MSKTRSRIVLNFYEDDYKDMAILEMLDELVGKRNRSFKVKDLLLEVFQQDNYKQRFNELENMVKKHIEKNIQDNVEIQQQIKSDSNNEEIDDIEKSLDGWSEE